MKLPVNVNFENKCIFYKKEQQCCSKTGFTLVSIYFMGYLRIEVRMENPDLISKKNCSA